MPLPFPNSYPKRPPFYAHRYCRLLMKAAVAQEIGGEAAFMLTIIAHQEDACGYTKPITYWNDQLAGICGIGSWKRLERIRARAVEAGWLHYIPGAKSRPARYWVTIPPQFEGMPDHATSEEGNGPCSTGNMHLRNAGQFAGANAGESEMHLPNRRCNGRSSAGLSGQHSSLSLSQEERERQLARSELDKVREKIREQLADQSVACRGPWLRRWACIARDYGEANRTDGDEITACLMWSIRTARQRGKTVSFPEHAIEEAREWRREHRATYRAANQPKDTP